MSSLFETAKRLVAPGKGILAADESIGTIEKRFEKVGVENTEENRRRWRELLFSAQNVEKFISGVIMFDESTRQMNSNGKNFVDLLSERGIIPGIKLMRKEEVGQEFVTRTWGLAKD
jgi:fructose-bisphosphate aldolase class I